MCIYENPTKAHSVHVNIISDLRLHLKFTICVPLLEMKILPRRLNFAPLWKIAEFKLQSL